MIHSIDLHVWRKIVRQGFLTLAFPIQRNRALYVMLDVMLDEQLFSISFGSFLKKTHQKKLNKYRWRHEKVIKYVDHTLPFPSLSNSSLDNSWPSSIFPEWIIFFNLSHVWHFENRFVASIYTSEKCVDHTLSSVDILTCQSSLWRLLPRNA